MKMGISFMMAMLPVHMRNMDETGTGRGPQMGEHTDEILKQYGYSEEAILRLKEAKAVNSIRENPLVNITITFKRVSIKKLYEPLYHYSGLNVILITSL